jgi:hypothetical protein
MLWLIACSRIGRHAFGARLDAQNFLYPFSGRDGKRSIVVYAIRHGKLLPSIRPSLESIMRGRRATADVVAIRNERTWPYPVPPSLAQVPELYIEIKGTGCENSRGSVTRITTRISCSGCCSATGDSEVDSA